ncbi:MAG: DinB family protein [Chloroflexi bacterium]|nr:DinB family protein [Chloroflexota bacterium]
MPTDTTTSAADAEIRRLEEITRQLTELLHQPAVAQRLRTAPSAADWSAMQVLGHMVEMIPFWLAECRKLIDAAEPPAFGRELNQPERLAGVKHGASGDVDELLRQWQANVALAAVALRGYSPAERAKAGRHLRRGVMSVADAVGTLIVAHAEDHLRQIQMALSKS